jgi:hypothetical protein
MLPKGRWLSRVGDDASALGTDNVITVCMTMRTGENCSSKVLLHESRGARSLKTLNEVLQKGQLPCRTRFDISLNLYEPLKCPNFHQRGLTLTTGPNRLTGQQGSTALCLHRLTAAYRGLFDL